MKRLKLGKIGEKGDWKNQMMKERKLKITKAVRRICKVKKKGRMVMKMSKVKVKDGW